MDNSEIGVLRRLIIRLPVRVIHSIAFHQTAETAASYEESRYAEQ